MLAFRDLLLVRPNLMMISMRFRFTQANSFTLPVVAEFAFRQVLALFTVAIIAAGSFEMIFWAIACLFAEVSYGSQWALLFLSDIYGSLNLLQTE